LIRLELTVFVHFTSRYRIALFEIVETLTTGLSIYFGPSDPSNHNYKTSIKYYLAAIVLNVLSLVPLWMVTSINSVDNALAGAKERRIAQGGLGSAIRIPLYLAGMQVFILHCNI